MKPHVALPMALVATAALSGCAMLGGGDKADPNVIPKEGRISILALEQRLEADLTGRAPEVPAQVDFQNWSQPGGSADNAPRNIAADGDYSVVWRRGLVEGSNRFERLAASPIVADGKIFALGGDQTLTVFDAADGSRRWSESLRPRERKSDRRAIGGGVAYADGKVFAVSGFGVAAAFDADTGKELWRALGTAPFSSAPTVAGGRVYAVTNDSELFAIDAATGQVLWTHQAIAEPARILAAPSPAVSEDIVVAPFASGEVIALAVANGRRLWVDALSRAGRPTSLAAINDVSGRPVMGDGVIYAVSHSGVIAAINERNGQRIWARGFASTQTPWLAGDALYSVSVDGELAAFERASGGVFWITQLPRYRDEKDRKGRIAWAGPILAGGKLVLASSEGELAIVEPTTGKVERTVRIGAPVYVPPVAAGGSIFVLDDGGRLTVLR